MDDLVCLPWGHIRYIIDNCKNDLDKALFFVGKTLENNWSRAVLLNFLGTDLYERQGKAITNYPQTLPEPQGELAQQITKDPYSFDFLTLSERYVEKELKDALVANIERFLLELGQGFAYMGREYRVKIGNTEKFMDMLFYNAKLHCYVVVEVKTEAFDAQNLGQLGLYVSAVNHLLKSPADNPTIGLLICRSKDNVVAKYALESTSLPIGISEYELAKVYPQDFQSTLPSIEQIEKELSKYTYGTPWKENPMPSKKMPQPWEKNPAAGAFYGNPLRCRPFLAPTMVKGRLRRHGRQVAAVVPWLSAPQGVISFHPSPPCDGAPRRCEQAGRA